MRSRALWFALLGLVWLLGCTASGTPPPMLDALDFVPREAEVGDRLEVIGTGFPEGKVARIAFRGTLYRPAERPVRGVSIDTAATSASSDRVETVMTERLQNAFCGAGERAVHTTFEGDVVVSFPASVPGALPVTGRVQNVRFDVRPPSARRAVVEAREREGQRALDFMGLAVADDPRGTGGLVVSAVRAGSPAAAAGIAAGEVLTSFEGVRVLSKADVGPSGAVRRADVGLRRPGAAGAESIRQVSFDGFRPSAPADLLGAGLVLLIATVIIAVFMAPTAGIITWVERRVSARMQSRIGPNRAGPQGFLQWVADGIKSLLKEDIIPAQSDKPLFRLAPYLVFVGVSATFCVMPFGQHLIAADLDIGILFVIAVASLVTIGLMTGGWASNNKWSLLGGIRSAAQTISYEIPGAIAIVCIVMMTGSLRMQDIVRAQDGWPWQWFMFKSPVTLALFFLWFTTALAEGNRAPFDLPEAESELVAGYSTEYSGMRYVFFFFAEWANVFVMSGIGAALFLGGWQIPGLSPAQQEASFVLQCVGAVLFQVKSWLLVFVVIWVRWTLPRIRIDQLMNLCWKWLVPASFLALMLTGVWLVWTPSPQAQTVISLGVFGLFMLLVVYFFARVAYNLRAANAQLHLNPLL
jgi:NADH-quinone oxidoreductase subunit H